MTGKVQTSVKPPMLIPLKNWQGRETERLRALELLARKHRPYTLEEQLEVTKLTKVLHGEPPGMSLKDFEREWLK